MATTPADPARDLQPSITGADPAPAPRTPLVVLGMVGPTQHPDVHGFRPGDHHCIVDDRGERVQAFTYAGSRVWALPVLARGQGGDKEWNRRHTDTPPGLYRSGTVWRDWEADPTAWDDRTRNAYGWASIQLVGLEGQEARFGRDGLMVHGGGSGLGYLRAWSEFQPLLPTLGCVRMHNADLQRRVLPLFKTGRIFWSVYQEA